MIIVNTEARPIKITQNQNIVASKQGDAATQSGVSKVNRKMPRIG